MNAHSTDSQYLFLHANQLRDPADLTAPIALARFLTFSGYLNLGLILLRHMLPDDPQYPSLKQYRWRHICDAHQQAHNHRLVALDAPLHLAAGEVFISAYDLQTDRTGFQLQRIAALLENSGHSHLADLVRRRRPEPLPRQVINPDQVTND